MDRYQTSTANAAYGGGWTRARQVQFLRCLADKGDVRLACADVGLSRQSVYKLRRRNPEFARLWSMAAEVARDRKASTRVAALLERKRAVRFSRLCQPVSWSVRRSPAGEPEGRAHG